MKRTTAVAEHELKILWKGATALSNKLFREAAELEDAAYQILSDGITSETTLKEFQASKDRARTKHEDAMQAWKNANIEMDKSLHQR